VETRPAASPATSIRAEETFDTKPKFFRKVLNEIIEQLKGLTIQSMERKIFWLSFTVLGLAADFVLPIWWALGATIPIGYISWWVAYRSGWFE
jgi:hypothetical protein